MDKPKFFRNKGTHYFKYLGTSLLILGVPILVISVYFNSRFLGRFREEVFETVDMELGQISLQLDNRIAQMRETASRLMIDGIISGARKAQDPYQLLPLISYLSILTSSNEWYEDIIINIFSCDYMVTSSTTWKKDLFWTFNFGPEKREFAKSMFGDDQSVNEWPVCVTSAEAGYIDRNVLFFILPLYSDYQIRYGSLIFRVKTSSMEKMISNRMISYNAAIMIQTPGGESIFTSGIIPDNTSSGFTARRYVSPETGWIYSAFLPDDQNEF
ncbi:MAG: hypothetical protein ACI4NM_04110, partial [Bullifex sp.]